ncbi:MAG: hypothetical protein ACTHMQ_02380 [Protaetiibacter sp.]
MPANPLELERARDRLVHLVGLHRVAALRATHPPRLGAEAWRGPAYELYTIRVEELASRLRTAAEELADAVETARAEVLHAAG